jgi:hypothetical protein
VPQRELGLPHQADYRRVFPIGKQVTVVVMNKNDSRGLTFSIARVDRVQERANYQAFTRSMHGGSPQAPASSLGSFGDLLRKELKLPAPSASALPAEVAAPTPAAAPAKVPEPKAASGQDVAATAQSSGWNDFVQQNSGKTNADKPAGNDSGVIRRQRKS